MSILTIVLVILVVGVLLYAVNGYLPMDSAIKKILNAVVVICLIVWLLKVFGILHHIQAIHV